jgi:hypothetical protein
MSAARSVSAAVRPNRRRRFISSLRRSNSGVVPRDNGDGSPHGATQGTSASRALDRSGVTLTWRGGRRRSRGTVSSPPGPPSAGEVRAHEAISFAKASEPSAVARRPPRIAGVEHHLRGGIRENHSRRGPGEKDSLDFPSARPLLPGRDRGPGLTADTHCPDNGRSAASNAGSTQRSGRPYPAHWQRRSMPKTGLQSANWRPTSQDHARTAATIHYKRVSRRSPLAP